MKILTRIRQYFCTHKCDLDSLTTIRAEKSGLPRIVEATCWKCGKVLQGDCGLHLPCDWEDKP